MKRLLILTLLLFVAADATDQFTADFNAGTTTNTNVTADHVELAQSSGSYVANGNYTSSVKDLGSNPTGTISWTSTTPSGTGVLVATRSGPTNTPDGSWSAWSSNYNTPGGSTLASPTNRYWQYRLQLSTSNTANTPEVNSVSIIYNQTGPNISADTANNANLTEQTSGAYDMHALISDTVTITTREGRYRIGSDSYSSWTALTQNSGDSWYLTIPEPGSGWQSREEEQLDVQIRATNNQSNTTTQTLSEHIDGINNPPTISSVSDQTALEGQELTVTVTASDADSDTLTYSSSHGSMTKVTNTEADLQWTPTSSHVGITNVTITVDDGNDTASTSFLVNTTGVNKQPGIRAISDQTAYYGDEVTWTMTVDDANEDENLTFSSNPSLEWTPGNTSNGSTVYTASASFYAFDNYKGTTTFTFRATDDDGATNTTTAKLTVNYCGDNTCQASESEDTCSQDCASKTGPSYLAIDFPERICAGNATQILTYNASSRYTCFYEGKTVSSAAYCEQIGDVEIQVYQLNGTLRTEQGTVTSNDQGVAQYTPPSSGRYLARATSEGLIRAEETFTAKSCDQDISTGITDVTYERPDVQADPRPTPQPREENPQMTDEEVNLLTIFIFYILVPLLTAGLVYLSTEYYQEFKDTDPRLLAMRVRYMEWRQKIDPYWQPYWQQAKDALAPYLAPAWQWTKERILAPINAKFVQPIKRKLEPWLRR